VSLLIPALTTQWSDRQKELEIKSSLVAQITESSAATIEDAIFFVEIQVKAWPPVERMTIREWKVYGRVADARYRAIVKRWRVQASSLESRLVAYFPDAHFVVDQRKPQLLKKAFAEYRGEVEQYILLTKDLCKNDDTRLKTVAAVEGYLKAELNVKPVGLDAAPESVSCWEKGEAFLDAYRGVGDSLLLRLNDFVNAIVRSNAAGYNVGARDFIRQILPIY
jgi:hypothetical protein